VSDLKEAVTKYWDKTPCGTGGIPLSEWNDKYFDAISKRRDELEPFIAKYAQFDRWAGKQVLEVGCGVGSDLVKFAKAGADITGIDLSPKSVCLARLRLLKYGGNCGVFQLDAEAMPFKDGKFDFVYSWGVLHHTPDTIRAISEIHRVTKSGGEICVMLYHKHSLVALQLWLLFGLFAGKPFRSLDDIFANHHESQGTKAYTIGEVRRMFAKFKNVEINVQLTPYDLRYKRNGYLPSWLGKFVPQNLGFFLIIQGEK